MFSTTVLPITAGLGSLGSSRVKLLLGLSGDQPLLGSPEVRVILGGLPCVADVKVIGHHNHILIAMDTQQSFETDLRLFG